jgi:putative Holliday junction resolvase
MSRLLAIDLGTRRVGLAIGDTDTGAVRPLATIRRASIERDARTLATLCTEQRIDELLVGLPLNMDGSEGAQAAATRAWAGSIGERLGRQVHWRDERLTSLRAEWQLGRPGRGPNGGPPSPAARNAWRARVDRGAAAIIVQAELDERAAGGC